MEEQKSNQGLHPNATGVVDALTQRFASIAKRARLILIAQNLLITLSVFIAVSLAFGLIDYTLRLPMLVRLIALTGLIYLVVRFAYRFVRPAVLFRLSPTDVALQIEQHDPSMRGLLAGAIDLRDASTANHEDTIDVQISDALGDALGDAAIGSASKRLVDYRYPSILNLGVLIRAGLAFVVVFWIVLGLGIVRSDHLRIGIDRVFMPWRDARWPMRYAIVDMTDEAARALDIAVPIRVLIGSSETDEQSPTRAQIDWRVLDSSGKAISEWISSPLVAQRRRDPQTGIPLYEQLIDANRVAQQHADSLYMLEYKLSSGDDTKPTKRIQLARPPELIETVIDLSLPEYAHVLVDSDITQSGITVLSDYDSILSPILAQSRARITWRFSKPIGFVEGLLPLWADDLLAMNADVQLLHPNETSLELSFVAQASSTIEPGIVDTLGIPVRTPIVLSLGVLNDQNPGASITEPTHDETVSSHAVIGVQGELTDDFGLSSGLIQTQIARVPAGSSGAHHVLIEMDQGSGVLIEQTIEDAKLRVVLSHEFELNTLDLQPGDQVWIQAIGWDLRKNQTDINRGRSESPIRVLNVVSDAELIEQVRNGLDPIRSALRQIDEQQSQLIYQVRDGQIESSKEQRSVTNRIEGNARSVDQMMNSIQRNRLDDPSLKEQLSDARIILDEAAQAGQRASDQIDRGQEAKALEQQEIVQDRIGELLTMLDRGQDSYLAMRSIQQLRDQVESIRDATAELGEQTAGRSVDQLSPEERSTLEQILDRQLDTAEDARDALSALDEHAQTLEENDPTQAEALHDAAEKGRRTQLEQRLKQAGEQIASNQTSSATQTQTEVLDELEEMIEELENTIKNRDNALRRELASIIESIKELIRSQQSEIDRLGLIDVSNLPAHIDAQAIALAGNTLSVRDDALGAFPETRIIAEFIGKAGKAQNSSIVALRQSPVDIALALRSDQTSLLNLKKALEEAQRLDEQAAKRQAQRLRNQLRDAYRASLETSVALRDDTIVLGNNLAPDRELSRRQRATARSIASAQTQVKDDLTELLERTQELIDSPVFALAHGQLDSMMSSIAQRLNERTLSPRVISTQDSAIMILTTLVEVLSDQSTSDEPEDFDDGQSGGSSGGSGGGEEPVIPPMAQLVLLRSMQQLAATQTRMMDQDPEPVREVDVEALSELQTQLFEHAMDLIEQMSNGPSPKSSPKNPDASDEHEQPIELDEGSTES